MDSPPLPSLDLGGRLEEQAPQIMPQEEPAPEQEDLPSKGLSSPSKQARNQDNIQPLPTFEAEEEPNQEFTLQPHLPVTMSPAQDEQS